MATHITMADEKREPVAHVEDSLLKHQLQDAQDASVAEHGETSWQSIKNNRKAIFWSALISMSIVMEGYDTILIGNFFGYPAFQKKYGRPFGDGYQLTGPWQVGLSNASSVGTIFGIFFNGWAAAKFGYRKVMIYSLFCMNAFIFILFFAENVQTLLVGEIFCGLAWVSFP
jgi:SP family general alpha glucoside:H+ symporter-like MFS transporter